MSRNGFGFLSFTSSIRAEMLNHQDACTQLCLLADRLTLGLLTAPSSPPASVVQWQLKVNLMGPQGQTIKGDADAGSMKPEWGKTIQDVVCK